ncbi:hypothetical protein BDQ17DRAFT_1351344 [Cyathus striatus]|nr:hypothetical protein BDQ17DRAFT_1351344 [Cyathus striatus]
MQDMRINVSEENSETVLWYKERFLADDEIVENVVHNPTSTICWTIHRPKRGWYIRIRSPAFPPGTFIPLIPVPQNSPYHVDAALSFGSRTNIPVDMPASVDASDFKIDDDDSTTSSRASVHSYPPTPNPSVSFAVHPPSPKSSTTPLSQTGKKKSIQRSSNQISQFVLAPHSVQPQLQNPTNASFFSRALSVLKSHRPSHSNSFTLSRVASPTTPLSPPPPYASNIQLAAQSTTALNAATPPLHPPLLVFHDRTPLYTVYSFTGTIEIDLAEQLLLGVDTSFWIAVALTYLEFLEERESYLAALGD